MSLSEEMPQKQPVFSCCEAAIRLKDQEREDIERLTKKFLKKNNIDEIDPTCNKLGGIDLNGHHIREQTNQRRNPELMGYPAHLPRPASK